MAGTGLGNTDRIPDYHLARRQVDEGINHFGLAIRHRLTAEDLKTTMSAYPAAAFKIRHIL